jgi:hypothetical protein
VLQLAPKKGGGFRGEVNFLNDSPGTLNGNPVSVSQSGSAVTFSFDRREDSFEGTLVGGRKILTGTWRMPGRPRP